MSDAPRVTPRRTLPDGTPNNTGLPIDRETVQINVEVDACGKGRRSDVYIIPSGHGRQHPQQVSSQWDDQPVSIEPTKSVTGTVWKDGKELHSFDLPGETYDAIEQATMLDEYLERQANGDEEAANELAQEYASTPLSGP